MKLLKITLWSMLMLTGANKLQAAEPEDDMRAVDEVVQAGEQLSHEEEPVSILDQALDGSSVETFSAGLAKVDEEASEKEYRSLMSALDYLLFFDIGANRDKGALYKNLDGLSPNQIRQKVKDARSKGRK